ncbi:hypothetical protein OHAE_1552 [Ochrobactrum soli]|uniref:Uncharacterized protein n=1 Tax=Ochrobactrum soli TaxID=2448455 RepID=A0A2P9HNH6_9HYPH|nr:hypothetical protein OHAE_1552 [[Ochrobactrum] soli]
MMSAFRTGSGLTLDHLCLKKALERLSFLIQKTAPSPCFKAG